MSLLEKKLCVACHQLNTTCLNILSQELSFLISTVWQSRTLAVIVKRESSLSKDFNMSGQFVITVVMAQKSAIILQCHQDSLGKPVFLFLTHIPDHDIKIWILETVSPILVDWLLKIYFPPSLFLSKTRLSLWQLSLHCIIRKTKIPAALFKQQSLLLFELHYILQWYSHLTYLFLWRVPFNLLCFNSVCVFLILCWVLNC